MIESIKRYSHARQDFENHKVGVELGEILRDLALTEGVVERVVDCLSGNPEPRGLVAVDRDLELRRVRQEIGSHIHDLRQRLHLDEQPVRPIGQLGDVRVLQRILERGAADPADAA